MMKQYVIARRSWTRGSREWMTQDWCNRLIVAFLTARDKGYFPPVLDCPHGYQDRGSVGFVSDLKIIDNDGDIGLEATVTKHDEADWPEKLRATVNIVEPRLLECFEPLEDA